MCDSLIMTDAGINIYNVFLYFYGNLLVFDNTVGIYYNIS